MDAATKRSINEAGVRRYFAWWDPAWRWILLVGLRDMRGNLPRLGQLAANEIGSETWAEKNYVYGPLALGITAAAVNEAAQHCEDLFALLSFLRHPTDFAKRIGSYGAGRVVRLAPTLANESNEEIAARLCVPSLAAIEAGMAKAEDPTAAVDAAADGIDHLGELVREVAEFYGTYEFFHVQYKHGLKLALRPFGDPTAEAIAEREKDVKAPLFALSNEPIEAMLQRPAGQQAPIFQLDPAAQANLVELVKDRNLLRLQLAGPEVDLDRLVDLSWTVSRLLQIAATNRLALGSLDKDGQQTFQLPGRDDRRAMINVRIEPDEPITLSDVS